MQSKRLQNSSLFKLCWMNLFCLLFWILIVSKIRCVSEEDVNAFPEQEENEKIQIFKDFLESCD